MPRTQIRETGFGIRQILLHPYAGLLSAYGIGLARSSWDGQRDGLRDGLGRVLSATGELPASIRDEWLALEEEGTRALANEMGGAPQLEIERSVVAMNRASEFGGGIRNMAGSHMRMETSTLSSNHALDNGGGLWHGGQGNDECTNVFLSDFLLNVTVAHNTSGGSGDGVHVQPSGFLCFGNTQVADGCGSMGTKGTVGNNLEVGNDCDFGAGSYANLPLDALALNGGPTLNHMPQTGSDAIDSSDNSICRPLDQRGAFRPPHFMGDPSDVCDVGAVETDGRLIRFEPNPFGPHGLPHDDEKDEDEAVQGHDEKDGVMQKANR